MSQRYNQEMINKYRFTYFLRYVFHVSGLKNYICMLIAIKNEPSFIFAL